MSWKFFFITLKEQRSVAKMVKKKYFTLGPTQPPIQWVPGSVSLGVKRPGREADHSPPSSAEIKE